MNEQTVLENNQTKPMNSSDKAGSQLWNQPDLHSRLQSAHDAFVAENPGTQRVSWASIFDANPALLEATKITTEKEKLNFHTWTYTHLDRSLFLKAKQPAVHRKTVNRRKMLTRRPRNEAVAAIASILKEEKQQQNSVTEEFHDIHFPVNLMITVRIKANVRD